MDHILREVVLSQIDRLCSAVLSGASRLLLSVKVLFNFSLSSDLSRVLFDS